MHTNRRVVVTGLGLATSLGLDLEQNWKNALNGVSGITKLSLPGAEQSAVQAAGQISEDDWRSIREAFPEDTEHEGERRTLFSLWAARSAFADAGLHDYKRSRDRFGVSLAAGLGVNRLEDIQKWIKGDSFDFGRFGSEFNESHPESLIKNPSQRPSSLIARTFGLGGHNTTITTACASATQAIGTAFRSIRRGDADLMAVGGTESMINPVGLVFFVLLGAAALSSDAPSSVCRPFDRKRSGLVMGEGAGIAILEEESHARERGAHIYAEVAGYGTSCDAYKVTAPLPKGEGAEQSMKGALEDAHMSPEEIDYINAHGTSTKLNDSAETLAIKKVFNGHASEIAINSSKSLIGHLIAASGAPEFVFTALSVQRDEVHPTINLENPDPKCDLDYVPNIKRSMTIGAAISNSFGFGGQNASIVLKKYIP